MPLVTKYSCVRKPNLVGELEIFNSLRAIGLAVEAGHKASQPPAGSLGRLTVDDCSKVHLTGPRLSIWEEDQERWRSVGGCDLRLRAADAEFAFQVVHQHRKVLGNLSINVWHLDQPMPRGFGYYDFLAEFAGARKHGCLGALWIEGKVLGEHGFEEKLEKNKKLLEEKLPKIAELAPAVEGVMILACKARQAGRGWQKPVIVAQLLLASGGSWKALAGEAPAKILRGRCKPTSKPSLQKCFDKMEWVQHPDTGERVGYLADFLRELGMPHKSPGKRSVAFNRILASAGLEDRVDQVALPNKSGSPPWLASEAALSALYESL